MSKIKNPFKQGWKYWLRLLGVGIGGGLLLAAVGYEAIWIDVMVRPARGTVCCGAPSDYGLDYEEVYFEGGDGLELYGWYIPSQNGAAVILLHGYSADRRQVTQRAVMLAEAGYGAFLYDLRGHGKSEGEVRSLGWADVADVPYALAWLQARPEVDPQKIGIFGFSVGGQIALRAAPQLEGLRAVAVDDPGFVSAAKDAPPPPDFSERAYSVMNRIDTWGISLRSGVPVPPGVTEVVGEISPRPIFFIINGPEDEFSSQLVEYIYTFAGEPKSYWRIPEAGHGGGPEKRPEEYAQRLVAFFNSTLLGAMGE